MANRNSSNNSTDRTLRTVLLVLLAALMLAYAFIATYKHEANPGKWWPNNKVEQPDKGGDDAGAGNNDVIVSDDGAESPLKLKLTRIATPLAGTATPVGGDHMSYKLTAELTPANTTDKLDIALSGTDASKITLAHEDGAFEATLTVTSAFSNTVTLTATVRNRNISKSISLDYLAKPKSMNSNGATVRISDFSGSYQIKMTDKDYDVGSIKPTKITGTVTFTWASAISNPLSKYGFNQTKTYTYDLANPTNLTVNIMDFLTSSSGVDEAQLKYDLYWAIRAVDDQNVCIGTVSFTGNYYALVNGVETNCGSFTSEETDFEVGSIEDLQTPATNMDIGGNILFY